LNQSLVAVVIAGTMKWQRGSDVFVSFAGRNFGILFAIAPSEEEREKRIV
jgi:hypothetical protein